MGTWPDVVTTALLGTDRRAVPSELPESWSGLEPSEDAARTVLDLAAQYGTYSRVGTRLGLAGQPPPAPSEELIAAPPEAQELLGSLLEYPDPSLINYWLASCVDRGLRVSAEHWQPLAVLVARNAGYDRSLLGKALGSGGLWFLRQNPSWQGLAADIAVAMSEPEPSNQGVAYSEEVAAWFGEIDAAFAATDQPGMDGSEMP